MQNKQIIKSLLAVSVAAALFGSAGVQAQTAPAAGQQATAAGTAKLASADRKAIMDMAMSNMAEIAMSKLAQSKSQNAEVKAFAQKMIDDHGNALTEVQTLAQAKGVTLPTDLDAKHKAQSAKLEKMSGDAFDKAYIQQGGLAAHKETLAKLQKGQKGAKDPDVKALVEKMIPVVEQHLQHAQQLASGAKGGSGSSGTTGSSHAGM